ncbi:MAG: hypothetical protein U0105_00325 [Candidatus Obscuribacterales bacterium]
MQSCAHGAGVCTLPYALRALTKPPEGTAGSAFRHLKSFVYPAAANITREAEAGHSMSL